MIGHLEARKEQAEHAATRTVQALAQAKGAIAASSEAIDSLTGTIATCPTCQRSISLRELEVATSHHEKRIRDGAGLEASLTHRYEELQAQTAALTSLLASVESLRRPSRPETPDEALNTRSAEAAYSSAVQSAADHNQQLGAVREQLRQLESDIHSDDQLAETEEELRAAYRREGIAKASAEAFGEAAAQVTANLIEPIVTEVRWRWKQLFSHDGMTLRPDGTIVRMEGGQELGWETFSGGEQVWARILTHLLVLVASTKVPFAWFDEPLEHLDPQLRHAVAATLASMTQEGQPQQLLVTTYEHSIATQLAEDTPNASLINVRSSSGAEAPVPEVPAEDQKQTRKAS